MAGKQFPSLAHARPASASSRRLLSAAGALVLLSAAYFLLLSPSSPRPTAAVLASPSPATTSFLASLDSFLAAPHASDSAAAPGDLDAAIRAQEEARLHGDPAWPAPAAGPLRVYVYEMPRKFTYDMLRLFRDSYRKTDNLTSNGSPVHRLIEQHSIDYWLWADLIAPESRRLLKSVVRVQRQEEADIFYVPFFTTISYFLLEKQECKALYRDLVNITPCSQEALKWVTDQPAWQRSEGRDHVIPVHHPWSFKSVRRFVKKAIWLLPDMDSTGNWYKPGQVYLEKDVILPYVPNVDHCDSKCVFETQSKRSILLFFRGRLKRNAGGKIRSKLVEELKSAEDIVIEEGSAGAQGKAAAQDGMRKSLFCLSPAGDTSSSARLFDAIVSGCIPVIISDELELPFEGILDYREIALFVSSTDALQPGWLVKYLRRMDAKRIREMQSNLVKSSRHFLYSSPARPLGPEDLTWRMLNEHFRYFSAFKDLS
ncbi:putative arabinosyltransferase ARAD1 [Panicum miliaceum]|uniref:Arabinosyltransferase ARAD1 n=1 Tax=Panicum miliaceum TaxID=4540 RepID=A0A3L6R281_PANMI|nr:putative arabinosyltransferase ARAD1 [Panicum miliaceum]